jgi:transposase
LAPSTAPSSKPSTARPQLHQGQTRPPLIEAIDLAITRYLDEIQQPDQNENPASSGTPSSQSATAELQRKLAKIKQRKTLLTDHQTRCQDSPTGQVNLTDPDARQLRKRGKSTVGYNVQAAVDAKHHLITTVEVTQQPTDLHLLDSIAQHTKQALDLPADAPLKVVDGTGDATGPQHRACEAHGTIALAPVQTNNSQTNGLYINPRNI